MEILQGEIMTAKKQTTTVEAATWWRNLDPQQRADVQTWLMKNPPSEDWSRIDWAFTECPTGLISCRYGKVL